MHHLAKVSFGNKPQIPYHAECACGTAGDFASNEDARNYLMNHLSRIQGINSAEFVDETVQPIPVPELEPAAIPKEVPAVVDEAEQEEASNEEEKGQSA